MSKKKQPARQRRRRNPAATRQALLSAARREFATRGLAGTRVDDIAARAGVNKQLVYHYYIDKENLYLHVIEQIYEEIRAAENELHLFGLKPERAIRKLVEFSFDHLAANPDFISLLNEENRLGARYTKTSQRLPEMHMRFLTLLDETLARGKAEGCIRKSVDATQLYISIAGLSYFYFSNMATLSVIFRRELGAKAALRERRRHIVDLIMHSLRP